MTKSTKIWMIVVLVALVAVAFLLKKSDGTIPPGPPQPPPAGRAEMLQKNWPAMLSAACGPARGNVKGQWTLIEVGDFQCPQCGLARTRVEKLVDGSNGKVKMVFMNWPLTEIHRYAGEVAIAALAGEKQGKFWRMYDGLYEHQKVLETGTPKDVDTMIDQVGAAAGLDPVMFKADRKSVGIQKRLADSVSLANSSGLLSTPTFLLRKDGDKEVKIYVGTTPQKTRSADPNLADLEKKPPWK